MTSAAELVEEIRAELQSTNDQLLDHPYVAAVEAGMVELNQLRPFAGEQRAIIASDLRSVAHLVSRFGGSFFLDVLSGEKAALEALPALAAAMGMSEADLDQYEPMPGAHAYAAYMAWLAAYASDAEVAAAYLVNFPAWGESCRRLRRALTEGYGMMAEQVRFFDLFADPLPGFEEAALAVVAAGLEHGASVRATRRAARLLQGYELLYWDTLLGELQR